TANGRKIPAVSVKAAGLNYPRTPLKPVTVGAPMTFDFVRKSGYRLPDPTDILITMGGSNLLAGIGYTVIYPGAGVDMRIVVNPVDADLKLTVNGVKVPTYKLTVRASGVKYTAEKTTLTDGVDKAIIQLRPATGYALPPISELEDYVTATMGGSPVDYDFTNNGSDIIIKIPKDSTNPLDPPKYVTGPVVLTANGYKLPNYKINVSNLTYSVTSPPITALGQDLVVLLRPKSGYQLPSSDNTGLPNQDVFVYEVIGGVRNEIFSPSMLAYDSFANTATLRVANITNNIEISAGGKIVPVYDYEFNPSPPVGLTYRVSSNKPIEHRPFTIVFQPREGYILPDMADVSVTMVGTPTASLSTVYSRTTDSDGKPFGLLEISSVTGDLTINIAGTKIASYTTDLSHLTATVKPLVNENSSLVVSLTPRANYSLPPAVTVTRKDGTSLTLGTDYTYDPGRGELTIPGFANTARYADDERLRITANGV
ncbi:MAG: hypothetical protein LBH21_02005, partial [Gracilibacteraceae bacterium]|nr:hypothetical protein [Gracilibacteraceae bacterium]